MFSIIISFIKAFEPVITVWHNINIMSVIHCESDIGVTRSSEPGLQNCSISLYRYFFLSSSKPSGIISEGRLENGKTSNFFSSLNLTSVDVRNSLQYTVPSSFFENRKW